MSGGRSPLQSCTARGTTSSLRTFKRRSVRKWNIYAVSIHVLRVSPPTTNEPHPSEDMLSYNHVNKMTIEIPGVHVYSAFSDCSTTTPRALASRSPSDEISSCTDTFEPTAASFISDCSTGSLTAWSCA